ncbi:hypothetical protein H6G36_01760 [Anabaena minutissima FACHB-250]|nr:hypothetical protein [Anabaena minutissima FACHB-250]
MIFTFIQKKARLTRLWDKPSLRVILIVPFVVQIIGAVGIVGYLSLTLVIERASLFVLVVKMMVLYIWNGYSHRIAIARYQRYGFYWEVPSLLLPLVYFVPLPLSPLQLIKLEKLGYSLHGGF